MSDTSDYEDIDPPLSLPAATRPRARRMRAIRIHTFGRYGVTRLILWLVVLLGWLFVLVGLVALVLAVVNIAARSALESSIQADFGLSMRMFFIASGIGAMLSGFLTIAFAQNVRANIDSADYARQSLVLQKALAEGLEDIDTNRMSSRPVNDLASDL